jgi:hypothetical protein
LCDDFRREGRQSRCDDIEQVADPSTSSRGRFRHRSPLHPDAVCEFPTNTYRGAASFRKGRDDFARIMKSIDVIRLVVDGEHCVALVNIDTVFASFRSPSTVTS